MDVVSALASVRKAGLAAEAEALESAIDESLCDEPIVHRRGSPTPDQIADAVVAKLLEHTHVIGAKMVQSPIPDGVPPVPWTYSDRTERVGSSNGFVLFESLDVGCGGFGDHYSDIETLKAIVTAVNAYFSPTPQPPTPAEASSANAETGIPDTAGYPVPDYDAVDIPSFGDATQRPAA